MTLRIILVDSTRGEFFLAGFSALLLLLTTGTSFFMVAFIIQSAFPTLGSLIDLWPRLTGGIWSPLTEPPVFGFLHAWTSTLIVAAIALFLAIPLGVSMALFTTEVAPPRISAIARQGIEILAGIPAVVYGFVGFVVLLPAIESLFDLPAGETLLAAGLILAIMILPYIASVSSDAFNTVPADMRIAAMAYGVSQFYVIRKVTLPKALSGVFAGVVLGLARVIGETLAVTMLAGNALSVPTSVLDRGQPLTALIATELGEAGVGSAMYEAIFSAGALLMILVIAINLLFWRLKNWVSHDA